MENTDIVKVNHLWSELYMELIGLLKSLTPEQWKMPTSSAVWNVKDISAHLLDGDLRRLSFQRDKLVPPAPKNEIKNSSDLTEYLNSLNNQWVETAKRLSPRVLVDMFEYTAIEIPKLFNSLNPDDEALFGVSWAGEVKSANWFDIAREYTEKWYHQQQIREAVGEPLLSDQKWIHPLIDTFMRGLPYIYQTKFSNRISGIICFEIQDISNGKWILEKSDTWILYAGETSEYTSKVVMNADTAWRMFSKNISKAEAESRILIYGDIDLGLGITDLTTFVK